MAHKAILAQASQIMHDGPSESNDEKKNYVERNSGSEIKREREFLVVVVFFFIHSFIHSLLIFIYYIVWGREKKRMDFIMIITIVCVSM